jgi:2-hydroxymuconate-semialdehyde hydrolase
MGSAFEINSAAERVWTFPANREALRRTAEVLIHDKSLIDDAYLDARMAILDAEYGVYFSSMFGGDKQSYIDQAVLTAAELAAVRCQVSMLHGRDDVGFPTSISLKVADRLPQADVTLLGSCSHSIAMEYPDKFLAAARTLFSPDAAPGEGE